jgi:hypothetical protein
MHRYLWPAAGLVALALFGLAALPAGARRLGTNGQIAYDTDSGVATANPDGSGARLLVPNSCCPGWSHDGSKLAAAYLTDDGRIGTATINANGSAYTQLPIDDPTLNIGCGVWSPSDLRLACEGWNDSNAAQDGIYTISSSDGWTPRARKGRRMWFLTVSTLRERSAAVERPCSRSRSTST